MKTSKPEPVFVLFAPDVKRSISPAIESSLHFARLAEVAAIAGAVPESVYFVLCHVSLALSDLESDDYATELNSVREYADNAALIAHITPDNCCGAINLLVKSLIDLQERVERSSGFGGAV